VLTLLTDRFRGTQEGTLHFSHLAAPGGLLVVARDAAEHHAHLITVLDRPDAFDDRIERFLRTFVRPRGLGQPAAALAADEVERSVMEERLDVPHTSAILRGAALGTVALFQFGGGPRWLWRDGKFRWPRRLRGRIAGA
jgi:hypothetical protein